MGGEDVQDSTKRIDGKACVSTSLLCEYFGVTKQAVNKWHQQGCPKAARGYWCVADVLAWRGDQSGAMDTDLEDRPLKEQKMYWETRCREEQAENQKFKNAVLRGDYIEKARMEKELQTFFVVFKQAVLSLPRKAAIAAAQYLGNQRARSLEIEMMEVITDALSEWSSGSFAVDSQIPDGPAAAGADDGKPVGGRKPRAGRKKQQ